MEQLQEPSKIDILPTVTPDVEPVTEAVETPDLETPAEATPEPEVDVKNESARDTVARVLKDIRAGKTDAPAEGAQQVRDASGKFIKKEAAPAKPEEVIKEPELDPELITPERLKPEEKVMFDSLPKGLKKAFSRSLKEYQGMTTKEKQELQRATQESSGIVEATRPFASKWAEQGHTVQSAILSLAAAQEKLTNPETSRAAYLKLGKDLDLLDEKGAIIGGQDGQSFDQNDISSHPQFRALQETVNSLTSTYEQKQLQEASAPIAEEMRAVQHEIDPTTNSYRYPELHDDAHLERLKPLVDVLNRTVPGISPGEALRRAHLTYMGQSFGASTQIPSRLPAAPQTNQLQSKPPAQAVSAAVTVRGRTGATPLAGSGAEPPPEALRTARDTVRWALAQQRNGQ